MSLQTLKHQALQLPALEKLALIEVLVQSLGSEMETGRDRAGAIDRMRGLAKTTAPATTDRESAPS